MMIVSLLPVWRVVRGVPWNPKDKTLEPSPPARLLLTGRFPLKPRGQDPCQSKLLCNSTPGVARGGFTGTPRTRPPRPHQVRASSISKFKLQLELSQFPHMEGTNAMFWRFELPWRGRMLMNLAELAAYVRDVKPESDVHSNLPNHRSPLEKAMVSMPQFLQLL